MTKKHFVIIISFLSVCLCLLFGVKYYLDNNTKEVDIESILATEAYSYLPVQAQEYIERVFALTGEVVLTEKNKQPKEYYLNPEFVEYLVSDSQDEYEVIPEEQIVDYYYTGAEATTFPSTFDLRNVSGKNFITPIKSQGSYGLCWSFATMEQAESLLLVKSNKSYSSTSSRVFSSRHADYATAKDSIIDVKNPYSISTRELTKGGYFTYIAPFAMDGLSYVPENWITYYDPATALEFNRVFNYSNSDLELNSSINMPRLNLATVSSEARTEYINRVKEIIMNYGGTYVATSSPTGNCSIKNGNYRFIYDDGSCTGTAHAMQIIGWDDNYSYNVCTKIQNSSNENAISTNTSSCAGTVVSGTGAWLLRNSWGNSNQYLYLAYDSYDTTINAATDISTRNWDNNYHNVGTFITNQTKNLKKQYTKKFNQSEKLVKIKMQLQTQSATYSVYLSTGENSSNNTLIGTIHSDLPGIYTLDVSSQNIILTDKIFTINITSSDGIMTSSYLSAYTSSVKNVPEIQTYDASYINDLSNSDNYIIRIESDVTGIADNSLITYKIFDSSNHEITQPVTYTENKVAAGKLYTKFSIDGSLSKGIYTVKSYSNNNLMSTSELNIKQPITKISGSGTKTDPYLVGTPAQLDLIRSNNSAYFKLINDIDMTYDTQNPDGLFYNDGLGWEPLYSGSLKISSNKVQEISPAFQGGLDGNGYKIIGLFINRPNEDYVGLFSGMYNKNYADLYVKNLTLENPNIT